MEYMWLIWVIVAIGFAIIEMSNASFFMIWFSVGALLALITALFTSNISIQFLIFLISSVCLLFSTRKITKNFMNTKSAYKTNIDTIKNSSGIVIEEINNIKGTGQVKIKGESWSAISASDEIIPINTKIIVLDVKGVKLIVEKDVTL
ncbi:NfeD family protein [Defluviitalea phaphyphila]|uniref:NfeD family protein n=1 Tax=Defluviitalea phaphyphila TaxID=1473580 RepID=UPI000730179B|nr:NfeD family protein [Defluviitalea phaphyphila]